MKKNLENIISYFHIIKSKITVEDIVVILVDLHVLKVSLIKVLRNHFYVPSFTVIIISKIF